MKYILTEEQYFEFWRRYPLDTRIYLSNRIKFWNKEIKPLHHLSYNDSNDEYSDIYFGCITGDEKHINLFILKYL
jgi:hypothetical protein